MRNKHLSRLAIALLVFSIFTPAFSYRLNANYSSASPAKQINPKLVAENQPYLQVLETDSESITLEFIPGSPEFNPNQQFSHPCETVSIPRMPLTEGIEQPGLPVQGAMLGIPLDGDPTLEVIEVEPVNIPGRHNLCLSPKPVLRRAPHSPQQLVGSTGESPLSQKPDLFLPPSIVELAATGYIRSQRFVEVRFSPLQYNPASEKLLFNKRIRVKVNFNSHLGQIGSAGNYVTEGPFEDSLRSLLLNYDQARFWRSQPAIPARNLAFAQLSLPPYKILVNQDGIYQLSYTALEAANVPVDSLDPRTFHLHSQDVEIAIHVQGEENGLFEDGEYVLFYGQKVNTKFTDTNVYWLSWGGANGRRMASMEGTPQNNFNTPSDFLTTLHAELDTDYFTDNPSGSNQDRWYWKMIAAYYYPPNNVPPYDEEFTFNLQNISSANKIIGLQGLIEGFFTYNSHHTRIYLNDILVDDRIFPANSEYNFDLSLTQSSLHVGNNTLRVECPLDLGGAEDDVLFNWFEIDYFDTYYAEVDLLFFDGDQAGQWEYHVDGFSEANIEAFDITDPQTPVYITGGDVQPTANGYQLEIEDDISEERHYLAQTTAKRLSPVIIEDNPSSWRTDDNGADYIIISHEDFLSQVQPLADYRAGQGLRVQLVDVQDLYDEFNGGVFSPEAIKSFLEYAYLSWQPPAPSLILLVGDGNFDYKGSFGWDETNFVPPYLADIDPWIGEVAADNRYVSVSGADILPDMHIGRFPVRTPTEAQIMVEKTINYEQNPPQNGWNSKLTFVADNADYAGNFPVLSENIINTFIPSSHSVERIYYGINYTTISSAREALQVAFNQGNLIVHYVGHAGTQLWASEGLLRLSDLPTLANGDMLPFILPMTCAEGYFTWPNPPGKENSSLGESIVRMYNGGAIASWSPSGYGVSSGHDLLERSLMNNLFNNHKIQLGYLTTHAKYDLFAQSSRFNDLIETYHLFGDPALNLQTIFAAEQQMYLPIVIR